MKLQIQAPEVVVNYYKYIGGVDKHDKLQITFALRKRHKFEKCKVTIISSGYFLTAGFRFTTRWQT
jgi:hypothetical protein